MARKPKRAAAPPSAAEALARIQASGITPLDYMLAVLRDESVEPAKRLDAAKAAAPYVHPRLASLALGNQDDKPFEQVIRWRKSSSAPSCSRRRKARLSALRASGPARPAPGHRRR